MSEWHLYRTRQSSEGVPTRILISSTEDDPRIVQIYCVLCAVPKSVWAAMWGTLILVVVCHCATPTGAQTPFGNAQKGVLVTAKEVRASHAPRHVSNVGSV